MSRTAQNWIGPASGRYPTLASAIYLGQEEFLRHALDVYQAAKRDVLPEPGESWLDAEGWPWATAQEFYDSLLLRFGERLRRRAQLTGHLVESQAQDDAGDNNCPEPGAGRSPADKGHGWPASPAGGPGCEPRQDVTCPVTSTPVISPSEDRL